MQTDIKRGLVLGILVLAVIIVLWAHFQRKTSASIVVDNATAPSGDATVVGEPVVPSGSFWESNILDSLVKPKGNSPTQGETAKETPATTQGQDLPQHAQPPAPPSLGNRYHEVKGGETLWIVAEKYYGNGGKWRIIADANKQTLPDPNVVPPGTKLVIPPDPSQTTAAKAGTSDAAQPKPDAAKPDAAKAEATKADAAKADASKADVPKADDVTPAHQASRSHIVASGESLTAISRQYYGTPNHWREILKANQAKVPSPDKLSVGTVLVIPPAS